MIQLAGTSAKALNWLLNSDTVSIGMFHVHVSSHRASPQGSILVQFLLSLYMLQITQQHGVKCHGYVVDTQLYVSLVPNDWNNINRLTDFLKSITVWITNSNRHRREKELYMFWNL